MRICLLALAASCVLMGQSAPSNDWLVVPGVRVGPITANTVRGDLKGLFPQATLAEDELELDEGMVFPATFVAREKQPESLAIVWTTKAADAHPKQIYMCRGRRRGECKWHTAELSVGTKLSDIEKINGKPFSIHGFGWGYGGDVESWDGGKLEKLACLQNLTVSMDGERRDGEFTTPITSEERNSFSGNRSIPTTNPALRKLNPAITEMLFLFPRNAAEAACPH
jgi:hypothetical protein